MPRAERVTVGLLCFFIIVGVSLELYWVTHARRLPELVAENAIARGFSVYGLCDRAYFDRVTPLSLTLEGINVYFTQILNAWLLWAILKRKPYRHALQLGVASYLSYSVALYFLEAHIGGYHNMKYRSALTFGLFYGVNAPWLLGHLYMVWQSATTITRALGERPRIAAAGERT